jgi:hypothetical protein
MMMRDRPRQNHSPAYHARVAGQLTAADLLQRHDVHPNQITQTQLGKKTKATES